MKFFLVISAIITISTSSLFSQDRSKINEWWKKYSLSSNDIEKIELLIENIGYAYEDFNPDSAILIYELAVDICNKNIEKLLPSNEKWGLFQSYKAIAIRYQGIVNRYLGNYDKSLELYNESAKIYLTLLPNCTIYNGCLDYKQSLAGCYNNIGVVYKSQGAYDKAAEYLIKSMYVFKEMINSNDSITSTNGKYGFAGCCNNIGLLYTQQGLYEKAEYYLKQSLKVRDSLKDRFGIAQCYNNIGEVHLNRLYLKINDEQKKEEFETSLQYFNKAIEIYKELSEDKKNIQDNYYARRGITDCLGNIGVLYKESQHFYEAIEMYKQSLIIRNEIGDKQGISSEYCNLGLLYLSLVDQNPNDSIAKFMAKGCAEKAFQFADEIGAIEEKKDALRILALVNISLHRYKKAEEYFTQLINQDYKDILLNFSFITEKEKEEYFKTLSTDFSEFYSFANKRNKTNPSIIGEVYNNVVRTKGLLLKSSTAMRQAIFNSKDKELIEQYKQWNEIKKDISKLCNSDKTNRDENIKILESKADSLEQILVKKSKFFNDFEKLQGITWKSIMANLKTDEAVVEFLRFNKKGQKYSNFSDTIVYCAIIIRSGMTYPLMIQLFTEEKLNSLISIKSTNKLTNINNLYKQRQKGLYELIWKPIEDELGNAKKIYFSPDGLLHKISFQAIEVKNNIYLSDIYELQQYSSTSSIAISNTEESFSIKKTTTTIFGGIDYNLDSNKKPEIWNYLYGTFIEAKIIDSLLKKEKANTHIYTDKNATENNLKKIANNSQILHLATHGFFFPDPNINQNNAESSIIVENKNISFRGLNNSFGMWKFVTNTNPLMRSGLILAGANKVWNEEKIDNIEDGILTAQEVTALDLHNTKLVVLSACETGLGDIRESEGVYGLQRAFKMAGAKYIIMSLWQVSDKETVEFMERFYKQLLKIKNIRQAFALTQKEMRQKYSPYFWAAFVLIE
ncbi:MAG TPA: CHAT domain-containing protein [Bacteroidales bacterium]|nr:CHAT domain-containing protein [Bacteroidales bacterium]